MAETPEMQVQLVSSHGMLAILEVLEGRCSRDVIMKLLQIINLVREVRYIKSCESYVRIFKQLVTEDIGFLEASVSLGVFYFHCSGNLSLINVL